MVPEDKTITTTSEAEEATLREWQKQLEKTDAVTFNVTRAHLGRLIELALVALSVATG